MTRIYIEIYVYIYNIYIIIYLYKNESDVNLFGASVELQWSSGVLGATKLRGSTLSTPKHASEHASEHAPRRARTIAREATASFDESHKCSVLDTTRVKTW